jgi:hypothetical protein
MHILCLYKVLSKSELIFYLEFLTLVEASFPFDHLNVLLGKNLQSVLKSVVLNSHSDVTTCLSNLTAKLHDTLVLSFYGIL